MNKKLALLILLLGTFAQAQNIIPVPDTNKLPIGSAGLIIGSYNEISTPPHTEVLAVYSKDCIKDFKIIEAVAPLNGMEVNFKKLEVHFFITLDTIKKECGHPEIRKVQ